MGCFSFRKKHEAVPEESESQANVSNSLLSALSALVLACC